MFSTLVRIISHIVCHGTRHTQAQLAVQHGFYHILGVNLGPDQFSGGHHNEVYKYDDVKRMRRIFTNLFPRNKLVPKSQ